MTASSAIPVVDLINSHISDARAAIADARIELTRQRRRIDLLETALNRMVCAHENTTSDSEGRWPLPDAGCIECTSGVTPDRYNTGPCAYHVAKRLLGHS